MSAQLKKKHSFKDSRWQYWIVFEGNKPKGSFTGTSELRAIMNYLISVKYRGKSRDEVVVKINDYLEEFQLSAKPVGKNKNTAMEEFEKYCTKREKFTDQEPPIQKIVIPPKFVQLKIPGLPPVHQDI